MPDELIQKLERALKDGGTTTETYRILVRQAINMLYRFQREQR